jgi:hydroxymethylglutaryl-CoA synthase
MTSVGIDAVEIWTGKLQLDLLETFAPDKNENSEKYRKGIGLEHSSFPDVYEGLC